MICEAGSFQFTRTATFALAQHDGHAHNVNGTFLDVSILLWMLFLFVVSYQESRTSFRLLVASEGAERDRSPREVTDQGLNSAEFYWIDLSTATEGKV